MVYSYLFEAKSIQRYLFQSGKLKDVIAASERLDRMIDSSEKSLLAEVLAALGVSHDLCEHAIEKPDITFLRCKGGALYAGSASRQTLVALRQLWTITIQQLFPSMVFTDALAQGNTLADAIESGHQLLAQDRNLPQISLPYASAYAAITQRTGKAAVPVNQFANKAGLDKADNNGMDSDTHLHRQAYALFNLREASSLQDRFTPEALRPRCYPINLDKDFEFTGTKDIALIHIDGNGLGLLLRQLKQAMQGKTDTEYRKAFRTFSEAVNKATEDAAQQATAWLAKQFIDSTQEFLPMRPLVLGGDDVTLLCHAKYALRYAERFCQAFKEAAKQQLEALQRDFGLSISLTASGGIVFQKAGHPFIQSHHLVEALCAKAKQLTKSKVAEGETGPAALACYRVNQVLHADLDDAITQSHQFKLHAGKHITLAKVAYLVDAQPGQPSWSELRQVVQCCSKARGTEENAFTLSRWRQMATVLANGNLEEAKRIFARGLYMAAKNETPHKDKLLLQALNQIGMQDNNWFNEQASGLFTPIVDLLNLAHFEEEIGDWHAN